MLQPVTLKIFFRAQGLFFFLQGRNNFIPNNFQIQQSLFTVLCFNFQRLFPTDTFIVNNFLFTTQQKQYGQSTQKPLFHCCG
jgi:hypothetical protein